MFLYYSCTPQADGNRMVGRCRIMLVYISFILLHAGMAVKAVRALHGGGARINLLNKRLHYQLTTSISCKLC